MTKEDLLKEAEIALQENRRSDAILYLESILEMDPTDVSIYMRLIKLFTTEGNLTQALSYAQKAHTMYPTHTDILFEIAYIYHGQNDLEQAIKYYDKYIELDNRVYFATLNKGLAYMNLGNFEKALEAVQLAIETDPKNVLAYLDKAKILEEQKKDNEVIQIYNYIEELGIETPESYVRKSMFLSRKNLTEEAIETLTNGLLRFPTYAYFYILLGEIKIKKEMVYEAIEDFYMALSMEPMNGNYYDRVYETFIELELYDEIEKLLIDYANAPNMQEDAINLEGRYATWIEDFKRAKKACERLLTIDPTNSTYLFNYAFVLERLGKYELSLEYMEKAYEVSKDHKRYFHAKLRNYLQTEKYEEALLILEQKYKTLELTNDFENNLDYLKEKADIFSQQKAYDKCVDTYKKMLEIAKELDEEINKNEMLQIIYLELGISYYMLQEYELSIENYEKSIEYEKENQAYLYRNIGLSYLKLEKNETALDYLNKALELKDDYADALYNKAEALKKLEKNEEALMVYHELTEKLNYKSYYEETIELLITMNKYEEAWEYLDKSEQLFPNTQKIYIDKAIFYIKQKKYEEALYEIERGHERFSYSTKILELMVDILNKLNRIEEAKYYQYILTEEEG